jgi:L-2,4-diaminobutyrate decarboxylase
MYSQHFLNNAPESLDHYDQVIQQTQALIRDCLRQQDQAFSGLSPATIGDWLNQEMLPEQGQSIERLLPEVMRSVFNHVIAVHRPDCMAHLHCPVLTASLAAEMLISAFNQSMDSWDQSGAATLLEQNFVNFICQLFGYDAAADGTMTSGGTQSNFMAVMLARDYALQQRGIQVQYTGMTEVAQRFRIFASAVGHFSIQQSAAILGLGMNAVIPVKTDRHYRMCPEDLRHQLQTAIAHDLIPICIVGTAGTTDFGSIDPLGEIATIAAEYQTWFHVDAAYGGALVLSDRYKSRLAAIHQADSITVDFHKKFYQPIPCSLFLLKDKSRFELMRLNVAYLNPEYNEDIGIPDLVTKSIQTTRRFDVLKPYIAFRALGRAFFAQAIDHTIDLAQTVAAMVAEDPELELAVAPELSTIVFRYRASNAVNLRIKQTLLETGEAVIGQTEIGETFYLKFTLINPLVTEATILQTLNRIKHLGQSLAANSSVKPITNRINSAV